MRGFILRVFPALLLMGGTGCGGLRDRLYSTHKPVSTPTHTYWQQASIILSEKPTNGELPTLLALIERQAEALEKLSPDGVDPMLVAAVQEVVRCEHRVLEIAAMADNDEKTIRSTRATAQAFTEANKAAVAAKNRLNALRGPLSERYGRGFRPLK